ncbi:MAG TPA: squalene/phytoene synthase family protein [Solirubrobacteraceae bacterium]|jgi:phytoene synthase|nr:squalene/phytoene synthase family protein [Solirubrobacteraceae bacterium]
MTTEEAYRECEAITRREAGNFFYGIRLLPTEKRLAMCAVYALARQIDDIGDGDLPLEEKRARLERVLQEQTLVRTAVHDAATRFPIPLEAFDDLVAGVRMDLDGARYEVFDDLELYCRRVAGSIGRLCVGVFGHRGPRPVALGLADDLGVAMQLTNILRDVREDAGLGRIYLPAGELARFGWNGAHSDQPGPMVRFQAERATEWFARGLALVPLLDRRSAACVRAMTGIYRRLLVRIDAHPEEIMRRRVSLPTWEKAWVAGRSLAGID